MRRVLIVDNDTDSSHLVKVLLEKTGRYLVLEENNGARAPLSARNFRPDLILLDVVMPEETEISPKRDQEATLT
jgi:CheY-like chemotaxis protein